MKTALVTGIAGQDGSYLCEYLLSKGYQVVGSLLEDPSQFLPNIEHLKEKITLVKVLSDSNIASIVKQYQPDEIYHLAAISHISFDPTEEKLTLQKNILDTWDLFQSCVDFSKTTRIFFAGTSEMFGEAGTEPHTEDSLFKPRSVYGISKVTCFQIADYFRKKHDLFISVGILFNHESRRRGLQFVTRKISNTIAKIKLGLANKLVLGNIQSMRDWGYAPEYVEAMWKMLQHSEPDTFILATGKLHSVENFVDLAFETVGLTKDSYIEIDQQLFRPLEKTFMCGNPAKARRILSWKTETTLKQIVEEMVLNDLEIVKSKLQS